ncbi:Ubiquitin-like-specific protease [Quillaja saponaria]|uniref:Ubiquitin-like-specific protease n=1 Tax=Quillaja saponaria TaxID=32244 RepID=A0AAD7LI32_QUISA|nr:Ubiquitin-like-specific protease [Quillaja saponaria]
MTRGVGDAGTKKEFENQKSRPTSKSCKGDLSVPFSVSHHVDEDDWKLIKYVFDPSSGPSDETLVSSSHFHLTRSEFTTLKPESFLDGMVINIVVDRLTDLGKKKSSLDWYLPLTFSTNASNDLSGFKETVEQHKIRQNYMSRLADCEKIFIPIHTGPNLCGHFYLCVVRVKESIVEIWDSLPTYISRRVEKLLGLDTIFMNDIKNNFYHGWSFAKFHIKMPENIPIQPNGYDCGMYVIKYMKLAEAMKCPNFKFHSDEERLALALDILKGDSNEKRDDLYNAVEAYYKPKREEDRQHAKGKTSCYITNNGLIHKEDISFDQQAYPAAESTNLESQPWQANISTNLAESLKRIESTLLSDTPDDETSNIDIYNDRLHKIFQDMGRLTRKENKRKTAEENKRKSAEDKKLRRKKEPEPQVDLVDLELDFPVRETITQGKTIFYITNKDLIHNEDTSFDQQAYPGAESTNLESQSWPTNLSTNLDESLDIIENTHLCDTFDDETSNMWFCEIDDDGPCNFFRDMEGLMRKEKTEKTIEENKSKSAEDDGTSTNLRRKKPPEPQGAQSMGLMYEHMKRFIDDQKVAYAIINEASRSQVAMGNQTLDAENSNTKLHHNLDVKAKARADLTRLKDKKLAQINKKLASIQEDVKRLSTNQDFKIKKATEED